MLYICIPVYNEAPTIGVLLWRIRATFQDHAREYELVVYDDGSTDATAEVVEPYAKVLPLTVLAGGSHRGYAASVDALCRHVAAHTRYPRRDAMVLMQGDFTDRPEHLPELMKRFEGGADIVATERQLGDRDPTPVRRLARLAPWVLRPFVRLDGVSDLTSTYRLVRISLLRDLLRERGDAPLVSSSGWAANAELLLALAPFARRIETLPVESRYDVRTRPSRLRAAADAVSLARFAWGARAQSRRANATPRPVPVSAPRAAEVRDAAAPAPTPDPRSLPDVATPAAATASRRRKRPRRETTSGALAGDASIDESEPSTAESATPPASTDAPVGAARRRRRRRSETEAGAERTAASAPEVSTDAELPVTDVAVEGEEDADKPARSARRSRRARKRRPPEASGDANATPVPDGEIPARDLPDQPDDAVSSSADDAGADAPARSQRRSRRGRRRGARSGSAAAPSANDDGPSTTEQADRAERASPSSPIADAS